MDERGRRKALGHRPLGRVVVLIAAWAGVSGCLGPNAIRYTRLRYNDVVRETNDQQLLINIVRLRYADSPVFIDLPNITSQFELEAGGSDPGRYGSQTAFGIGGMTGRDTPTLSYHPREGREIAKSLLSPISPDLFSVVNAGANIEQLLLLTINDINDVNNAARATTLTPRVPDDNSEFVRGIRILSELRDRDATEAGDRYERGQADEASDPIPANSIGGRDLLNAAKEGYVFRERGEGRMTVIKRDKELFLKIRHDYIHSPEMEEVARIFRLTPGLGGTGSSRS